MPPDQISGSAEASLALDSQRAADAAAGDAVYPIEHRRKHGDHRSTDGHAGHLAGGEAVIIEVHNHEVEGGDDCRAHDGGHKKHLGHLPLYGPEQIAVRRPQVPQVVVHPVRW